MNTGIRGIERVALLACLMCMLVPVAARGSWLGLPLYGVPMIGVMALWAWRAMYEPCLFPSRAWLMVPFLGVALLLGMSTWINSPSASSDYFVWFAGLLIMLYANQNWRGILDYRLILMFALLALIVEVSVGIAQLASRTYIGNAVMYFGRGGDISEDVRVIAGGRVFRPVGTVGLPNQFSLLLVMLVSLVFPALFGQATVSRTVRIIATALALLALVVIVLASSRGSALALLGVPLLFGALHSVRIRQIAPFARIVGKYAAYSMLGSLLIAIVLILLTDVIAGSGLVAGLQMRIESIATSAQFRWLQYFHSAQALINYPVTGMGLSASSEVWSLVDWSFPGKEDFAHPPHNAFLVIALEAGLLAGLLYAGALFWILAAYPLRILRDGEGCRIGGQIDGMYVALFVFTLASLIYIAPLTRTLWPLGCLLIGVLQAEWVRSGERLDGE